MESKNGSKRRLGPVENVNDAKEKDEEEDEEEEEEEEEELGFDEIVARAAAGDVSWRSASPKSKSKLKKKLTIPKANNNNKRRKKQEAQNEESHVLDAFLGSDVKGAMEKFQEICPFLTIGKDDEELTCTEKEQDELKIDCEKCKKELVENGFSTVSKEAFSEKEKNLVAKIRKGVEAMKEKGLPPSFVCLFDQVWALQALIKKSIGNISGGNVPVHDTLAFFVDEKSSGFSVHRDRVPEDWNCREKTRDFSVKDTFHKRDQTPMYCTVWIALTDLDKNKNSCLSFLPAKDDKSYKLEEEDEITLSKEHLDKNGFTAELKTGGATIHSHRALHWGSAICEKPRASISFSFADPNFEVSYLRSCGDFPSFALRRALICSQLINYSSLIGADFEGWKAVWGNTNDQLLLLKLMHRCFRSESENFNVEYVAHIAAKFMALAHDDEDDEDEALDAMLDAEMMAGEEGGGFFHDDFDSM